ncbi:phage protein [Streptococcus pneumoniae]|nr:hypothetical protein [Streptococcus pneumoniae]VJR29726.1 phage protein [Streptococcus pneumoniae]VLL91397.1 phage protein [Streptococcus pneumoniae]VLQ95895.1 phage protein [Streptococcus pneumoniae]
MSQQHRKWNELVKERDGKGSDDLKLRINKKLRINESWEKFEE